MEWTTTINDKMQYLEIVTRGVADRDGSLNMAKTIAVVMKEKRIKRLLIDQCNIESVSGQITEVYQRPKQFVEIGVINEVKIAEIVKQEHKEFFNFLELVCINNGYTFAIFTDKKSALEWLLKQ
jgi:hypothetical protein